MIPSGFRYAAFSKGPNMLFREGHRGVEMIKTPMFTFGDYNKTEWFIRPDVCPGLLDHSARYCAYRTGHFGVLRNDEPGPEFRSYPGEESFYRRSYGNKGTS